MDAVQTVWPLTGARARECNSTANLGKSGSTLMIRTGCLRLTGRTNGETLRHEAPLHEQDLKFPQAEEKLTR